MIAKYADENNISYIDCCSEEFMQKANYCFATDNADYGHGNTIGAIKVTDYIGAFISSK